MIGYTRKVGLRKSRLHLRQVPDRDDDWLRDQVHRSAATLDGLDPELRETLAHRTRWRNDLRGQEWCNRPNHPDIPEPKTGPDGDMYGPDEELIEDYCDYVNRVDTHLSEHPPTEPPGFYLIPCYATPRHQPEYIPVFHDVYEPTCRACHIATMVADHAGCEHSHHKAWRHWRITKWALGWGYEHGLVKGYGNRHDAHCKGCVIGVKWGRGGWFNDRRAS